MSKALGEEEALENRVDRLGANKVKLNLLRSAAFRVSTRASLLSLAALLLLCRRLSRTAALVLPEGFN